MVLPDNMVNISIEKLNKYMCKDFYDDPYECHQCMEGKNDIDCTCVLSTSFNQVGSTIVGDLKNMDG